MLAVLAAKRRWQNKRWAEGKSTDKPNIVCSAAVQVVWEKAFRYFEVEEKYWYCRTGEYKMNPKEAVDLVDENTCLVVGILGTTYTGQYEDILAMNDLLEEKNKKEGLDCRIHRRRSGGFVAPFVSPDLKWDVRVPLVASITISSHTYGLCLRELSGGDPSSKHHPAHHSKMHTVHPHEKHSLAGKYGKTHAVC
ncbi:glutamate decarboxylase gad1 [Rhodosporidiobolus nylandii]